MSTLLVQYMYHSFLQPYGANSSSMDASLFIVAAYGVFTLAPAFLVTIISSIWAFLEFKKRLIVTNKKDIGLSQRILFIPVIMVLLLFCNSLLSYLTTVVSDKVLDRASLEPFFGNWANFLSTLLYFVLDILHALSYPLVLLFLYTCLRKTWKRLLFCELDDFLHIGESGMRLLVLRVPVDEKLYTSQIARTCTNSILYYRINIKTVTL